MAGWTTNGRLPHRGEPQPHCPSGDPGDKLCAALVTCSPHSVYGIVLFSNFSWIIERCPYQNGGSHLSFQLAISGKLPLPLVQGQPRLPSEFQVNLGHRVKLYLKK